MDGRAHFKGFIISLIIPAVYLILTKQFFYFLLLLASGSLVDPDEDQKWEKGITHRNFFTHSMLFPLIISTCFWLVVWKIDIVLLAILIWPTIIHLILDCFGDNKIGKWKVWFFGKRIRWTLCFFILNILIGLGVWIYLWIKYLL